MTDSGGVTGPNLAAPLSPQGPEQGGNSKSEEENAWQQFSLQVSTRSWGPVGPVGQTLPRCAAQTSGEAAHQVAMESRAGSAASLPWEGERNRGRVWWCWWQDGSAVKPGLVVLWVVWLGMVAVVWGAVTCREPC